MKAEQIIVTDILKQLINKNGPDYITDKPYEVYKKLVKQGDTEQCIASGVFCVLVNGLIDAASEISDPVELSGRIQKGCCFNKKLSDRLADIFVNLYSDENKVDWKSKNKEGLSKFLMQEQTFKWEGQAVWDEGNGTVDCYYDATIILQPMEEVVNNKELKTQLESNPFLSDKAIYQLFAEELDDYLDSEFQEYCTCDDYYQPVVEDFEIDYYVKKWCEKNGFEVISCEGNGGDGGYEPKFRRGWY